MSSVMRTVMVRRTALASPAMPQSFCSLTTGLFDAVRWAFSWPKEVLALIHKAQAAINLIVFMVCADGEDQCWWPLAAGLRALAAPGAVPGVSARAGRGVLAGAPCHS